MPGKKTGLTKPVPKVWLWEKIVVRQCHTVLESGMAFARPAGPSTPPLMYMYTLWFTRLHAHQYVMSAWFEGVIGRRHRERRRRPARRDRHRPRRSHILLNVQVNVFSLQ